MLQTLLQKHHYKTTAIHSAKNINDLLKNNFYDIVLTDMRLPDISGIEVLKIIKQHSSLSQIIMMTSYANYNNAIQSIKEGAFHYIPKPFSPEELLSILKDALSKNKKDTSAKKTSNAKHYFEGTSAISKTLKEHIHLVGPTPLSVLITGASGTGKENVAKTIHDLSDRANGPFIAVDCGAIPTELVGSEFFGHAKGSFTGAITDKIGYFEAATGGTLFLDEVGNLSYNTQIQLLRALQEQLIKPIGTTKEIKVDVRIISATNEDLKSAQEKGQFREDLFHRLNEFEIKVPSLCQRGEDIMLFAHEFLKDANIALNKEVIGFEPAITSIFNQYGWPGNLREMKNVIKRATLLTQDNLIRVKYLPIELVSAKNKNDEFHLSNQPNEKELIIKALNAADNNKSKAAKLLNIDRKTLYNKLKLHQITTT